MSKLISLLKATMSGGLQLFNYRGKTERSRRMMPFVLASLIGVSMLMGAGAIAGGLKADGSNGTVILSLYTIVTSIIIIMEGIYKSGDLLFKPKDNDLLASMPIQGHTIILARIIKFYIFEMLYCLIFLLPAIIVYASTFGVTPTFPLLAITMLLFSPIIPIAISCIVGLFSSAVASKFKHKNFLQVILSLFFLIVMTIFILLMNTSPDLNGRSMLNLSNQIAIYYYPANAFASLATSFDFWQYLLFIVINLVVLGATVLIIGRFYPKITSRLSAVKQKTATISTYHFSRHSQTFAMIKKEIIRYFSTPVLLMNTAVGLVIFAVVVIALCTQYDNLVATLTSTEDFPLSTDDLHSLLPSAAFVMVAFTSLMTFITATMISLEGKSFNLLKSMPISGKKVIMTKVLAAVLLIAPITALGSLIMAMRFQFGFLETILVLIAVIATPLVTELVGILIDLKYARFDAESDAAVVKQSAGVLVATFLGLGMFLFTAALTIAIVFMAGQMAGLIMMNAIFVIVSVFLYFIIATRGEEKYTKLVA